VLGSRGGVRSPAADPRARHQNGTSTGELAANTDIAPTILELAGVKPDKASTGPRLSSSCATPASAPGAASCSRPSSRPTTSKPTANRRHSRWSKRSSGAVQAKGRSEPRGRTTREPASALQVHRVARRESALRHQQRPERAQQHRPSPHYFPIARRRTPQRKRTRRKTASQTARLPKGSARAMLPPGPTFRSGIPLPTAAVGRNTTRARSLVRPETDRTRGGPRYR